MPLMDEEITVHERLRQLQRDMTQVREHNLPKIEYQVTEHSHRIGRLEQFKFMVIGAVFVLTALVVPIFLEVVIRGAVE